MEVSTSILSVKDEKPLQVFYDIEVAKTDYFHIDVMDGKFVEQNTENKMKESALSIKHISNIPLDVHLMVKDVGSFLEEYLPLEPAYITVHYESFESMHELKDAINKIKDAGCKVGVAIKPKTDVKEIKELLPYINLLLVMTVEPGLGGQEYIEECTKKIEILNEYRKQNEYDFFIEVDGGINEKTAPIAKTAGADILVAGTAIINAKNKKEIIKILKE